MKYYLIALFLFISIKSKPCDTSHEWPESYFFYNIFDQTNISNSAYYPFLRTDDSPFYCSEKMNNKGNLSQWKIILPQWNIEDINRALIGTESEFNTIWNKTLSNKYKSSKQYMFFARKCAKELEHRGRNIHSWSYRSIINNDNKDVLPLLAEAMSLFKNENNKQLKIRYAYQIIRLFHYSKQYQQAINFFSNQINNKHEKSEIYYYSLDQIAGCYYSLKDYETSAYLFLNVFNHSSDKKESALMSYSFCTNHNAEGKIYFKNIDDSVGYYTLRSLRSFTDYISNIKNIYKISPNDPRLELVYIRALNDIERQVLPALLGTQDTEKLPKLDINNKDNLLNMYKLANIFSLNRNIKNKDFWRLCSSYTLFLSGRTDLANRKLRLIRNEKFKEQINILSKVYKVFLWKNIDSAQEHFLAQNITDIIIESKYSGYKKLPAWKHLINTVASHIYYSNGDIAKAFLMQNSIKSIEHLSSLQLIDSLLSFVNKPNKNYFEKYLLLSTNNIRSGFGTTTKYLHFVKGLYYLQNANPEEASLYLFDSKGFNYNKNNYRIEGNVNAKIFSNNIKECYECEMDKVMLDSVYLSSIFSFIKPQFTKATLAENLIKLEKMTNDKLAWKRKLAHYLLGNYYYNVSNTGYFRGTLRGQSNCCYYNYFERFYWGDNQEAADLLIKTNKGYNLSDIAYYPKYYFNLSSVAYNYYQLAIDNSNNKELNARCLYMMAKCEQNTMFNIETNYSVNGSMTEVTSKYKLSFKRLKSEYSDTKFNKMILKECSFYRYYCSQ